MALKIAFVLIVATLHLFNIAHAGEGDHELNILELSKCPFQVEPIGCFKDKFSSKERSLPEQLINSRDTASAVFQTPSIQWKNYHHWTANFICECAKKLFQRNTDATSGFIGLQFFGECWAHIDKYLPAEYHKHGQSEHCINTQYHPIPRNENKKCGLYFGKQLTNYVYKVSKIYRACPEMNGEYLSDLGQLHIKVNDIEIKGSWNNGQDKVIGELTEGCKGNLEINGNTQKSTYDPELCKITLQDGKVLTKKICKKSIKCPHYKSRGCFNDPFPNKKPEERPMPVYAMNERDPQASNWKGRLIDWRNWGKGYLADLLCRCAKIAKQTNQKFFSIQFYGECWTSDNDGFMKHGNVTRCLNHKFENCEMDSKACHSEICAGEWEANKVYEITQGPHMCDSNPCKHDGECITDGPEKFSCACKSGTSGELCETITNPTISINPDK